METYKQFGIKIHSRRQAVEEAGTAEVDRGSDQEGPWNVLPRTWPPSRQQWEADKGFSIARCMDRFKCQNAHWQQCTELMEGVCYRELFLFMHGLELNCTDTTVNVFVCWTSTECTETVGDSKYLNQRLCQLLLYQLSFLYLQIQYFLHT